MISQTEVRKIANLSKLQLTDKEAQNITQDLAITLTHAHDLDKFDANDSNAINWLVNITADDQEEKFLNPEKLFSGELPLYKGQIRTPKAL